MIWYSSEGWHWDECQSLFSGWSFLLEIETTPGFLLGGFPHKDIASVCRSLRPIGKPPENPLEPAPQATRKVELMPCHVSCGQAPVFCWAHPPGDLPGSTALPAQQKLVPWGYHMTRTNSEFLVAL